MCSRATRLLLSVSEEGRSLNCSPCLQPSDGDHFSAGSVRGLPGNDKTYLRIHNYKCVIERRIWLNAEVESKADEDQAGLTYFHSHKILLLHVQVNQRRIVQGHECFCLPIVILVKCCIYWSTYSKDIVCSTGSLHNIKHSICRLCCRVTSQVDCLMFCKL